LYIVGRSGASTTSNSSAAAVPSRSNAVTTESPTVTAPVSYQNTRRSANPRGGSRGAFRGRGGASRGFQPMAFSAPAAVQYVQFGMQQFDSLFVV